MPISTISTRGTLLLLLTSAALSVTTLLARPATSLPGLWQRPLVERLRAAFEATARHEADRQYWDQRYSDPRYWDQRYWDRRDQQRYDELRYWERRDGSRSR